jgi:hypothetical protein
MAAMRVVRFSQARFSIETSAVDGSESASRAREPRACAVGRADESAPGVRKLGATRLLRA